MYRYRIRTPAKEPAFTTARNKNVLHSAVTTRRAGGFIPSVSEKQYHARRAPSGKCQRTRHKRPPRARNGNHTARRPRPSKGTTETHPRPSTTGEVVETSGTLSFFRRSILKHNPTRRRMPPLFPSWSAGNAAQGDLTAGKAAALPSMRISR